MTRRLVAPEPGSHVAPVVWRAVQRLTVERLLDAGAGYEPSGEIVMPLVLERRASALVQERAQDALRARRGLVHVTPQQTPAGAARLDRYAAEVQP